METKKSAKANLEKGKSINLLMGLIVGMAVLFVGFEWGTQDVQLLSYDRDGGIEWVEELPITIPEPTPPPPPPPQPVVTDIFTVVDDDAQVDDTPIMTTEDSPRDAQPDIYVPPVDNDDEKEDENMIFQIVEEMPEFPGGEGELLKYISRSIKYPVIAQESNIQGRVICAFVINRDGSVVDGQILRGVDPSLDKEALRVISTLPKWKPGKQRGKPVRVKYTVPITFRLQ